MAVNLAASQGFNRLSTQPAGSLQPTGAPISVGVRLNAVEPPVRVADTSLDIPRINAGLMPAEASPIPAPSFKAIQAKQPIYSGFRTLTAAELHPAGSSEGVTTMGGGILETSEFRNFPWWIIILIILIIIILYYASR